MEDYTSEKLTKHYGQPILVAEYKDEATLDYVEAEYFVRSGLRFLGFLNTKGLLIVWQSIGQGKKWHPQFDHGWLLRKIFIDDDHGQPFELS